MPPVDTLVAFIALCIPVLLVPGPSNVFIVTQGVSHGQRVALAAAAGITAAGLLRVGAAALGLAGLVASVPGALTGIRWGGAAYLLFLSARLLLRRSAATSSGGRPAPRPIGRVLRGGFLIGIANPKMLLFYVAFLPQFVVADAGPPATQIAVLGALFWVLGAAWDIGVALLAGRLGEKMSSHESRSLSRAEGLVYVGLAGWVVLA